MLTKEFNTTIRDELVDIAYALAKATPSCMLLDKAGKPIIIQIEGCSEAGKSLFWDEYTKALFNGTDRMVKSFRPLNLPDDDFRFPELWKGTYQNTALKILFFNAGVCHPTEGGKLLSFIRQIERGETSSPRERGDILMINQFQAMLSSPINSDIKIVLTNTENEIPFGQTIPDMPRHTSITAQGQIANSAKMRAFLSP